MRIVKTASVKETQILAQEIAAQLKGGDVLALVGDLGAGKTTFVQGLAQALGVKRRVKSPTFVRLTSHKLTCQSAKLKILVHVDAYRVKSAEELRESGLPEYLERNDVVTVIEWADRVKELLPKKRTRWVYFEHGAGGQERDIRYD